MRCQIYFFEWRVEWYVKIDSFFYLKGFVKNKNDPNLYVKKDEKGKIGFISLYVDDLIIKSSACKLIEESVVTRLWDEKPWWIALLFRTWSLERSW